MQSPIDRVKSTGAVQSLGNRSKRANKGVDAPSQTSELDKLQQEISAGAYVIDLGPLARNLIHSGLLGKSGLGA
jgi:anti-sigma28 factor (negative regulator of flagellin synthesis)